MEFFKKVVFLLPNWAWFAIAGAIALLLIAIIIIACCTKKGDKVKEDSSAPVLMPADEETKKEEVKEPVAPVEEPEPVLVEEQPVEKKPAAKKTTAKTTTAKTTATKTTAEKPATKTTTAKTTTAKTTAAKAPAKTAADADEVKVYHISKREDKKWEVRIEGGDKALKLFFTQKEAIDYTRKISGKKRIIVHKEDGGKREV